MLLRLDGLVSLIYIEILIHTFDWSVSSADQGSDELEQWSTKEREPSDELQQRLECVPSEEVLFEV